MRIQEMNQVDVPSVVSEVYQNVLRDYPDILDVNHVSAILGVSNKTVYSILKDSSLSHLKVGRAYKIPKFYMLQYIKVIGRVEQQS